MDAALRIGASQWKSTVPSCLEKTTERGSFGQVIPSKLSLWLAEGEEDVDWRWGQSS